MSINYVFQSFSLTEAVYKITNVLLFIMTIVNSSLIVSLLSFYHIVLTPRLTTTYFSAPSLKQVIMSTPLSEGEKERLFKNFNSLAPFLAFPECEFSIMAFLQKIMSNHSHFHQEEEGD